MAEEDKKKSEESVTGDEETAAARQSEPDEAATGAACEPTHISEDELRRQLEEHFRKQDVSDVLTQFLISLSTLAYVKMGITEDTEEFRDMTQAGLAIDAFKSLLETIRDRLPEQDASALAGALASMQVTFAKASEGK